jgi:hypothetical protein
MVSRGFAAAKVLRLIVVPMERGTSREADMRESKAIIFSDLELRKLGIT